MRSNKINVLLVRLSNGEHISVDQAFKVALSLHQTGKFGRAAEIYHQIIKEMPRHADALHLFGLAKHQLGDTNEAIELIRSAIKVQPNVSLYHSNLSEIYYAIGQFEEASSTCMTALKLSPEIPEIHLRMGMVALAQKFYDSAITSYNKALCLKPDYIDALLGLGDSQVKSGQVESGLINYQKIIAIQPNNVAAITRCGIALRMLHQIDKAIDHYKKAISRLPAEPDLYNNLSLLYQSTGNKKEAIDCLRTLLVLTPDDEAAKHLLSALSGSTTAAAPAEYVRSVFDGYAASFESHLVHKLDYRVPEMLAVQIKNHIGVVLAGLKALDLGCGTGLMGLELKGCCENITGVDISPKMIEQTQTKNIYTELVVTDIIEFMQASKKSSYDLIVSTDVFIYIGDLENIFAEAARLLTAGGLFAFSVEANEEPKSADAGYALNDTGRYSQSQSYLDKLRLQFHFTQAHFSRVRIRNQDAQPVYGYLCIYQLTE